MGWGTAVVLHSRGIGRALVVTLVLASSGGCYSGLETARESGGHDTESGVHDTEAVTATGAAEDTSSHGGDDSGEVPAEFVPGEPVLPRLTESQYRNAIIALLGPRVPIQATEPDTHPYLFRGIGAASTSISEVGVQQYEASAEAVTQAVFSDALWRADLVGCEPQTPGDDCTTQFLADFGRRAYRRPLDAIELQRWVDVSAELAADDPWRGLRLAVSGMLQSPHFLYRVELGEPDPDDPTRLRYTNWEMASRLSFLLWNTIPDDILLQAADAGELVTEVGVARQTARMLEDDRARVAVQRFFAQYFDLVRLDGLFRDPDQYPAFTATLPEAMRTEVELLVDDFVFRRAADVRGIFGARQTFVNDELAALYGVDAPGAGPVTFVPVDLPADGLRAGLLTLGAFLAMNAHETETSPTLRGKYVRERVMCMKVPAPPIGAQTSVDDAEAETKTLRERLQAHRTDPVCAGCHGFIDPPGFSFQHFDAIGAYRTDESGFPVDASGEIDGVPLTNATELGSLLETSPHVGRCIVIQLFRHTQGRLEVESEQPALDDLDRRFAAADYRFLELLVQFTAHESFRYVSEHPEEGE